MTLIASFDKDYFRQLKQQMVKRLKQSFRKIVTKVPVISDYYQYHWLFNQNITACRGVYSTFAEALQAIPKGAKAGYNQPEIHNHRSVAKLTTAWEANEFNSQDYPVVAWLGSAFANSSTIFDIGGNVGHAYYTYKKFLQYPNDLRWIVCDIPEVIKAGEQLARKADNPGLSFTTQFADAEGAEILLTCGALQYIEPSLSEMLGQLKTKPRHILINRVPFYDGEKFITLQNIGYAFCPYKIQNRPEFIASLSSLGYELIDTWTWYRTCHIPFNPDRFVRNYYGFYLRLSD
ncbi:MAG: TIGR04325 family methyltransferase [Nostoc sp.]|uniref:TIGR04325 family methyltransferase n=1 Tax=Nostoc sp. TaxID=1180 RepID=UPI002FF59E23